MNKGAETVETNQGGITAFALTMATGSPELTQFTQSFQKQPHESLHKDQPALPPLSAPHFVPYHEKRILPDFVGHVKDRVGPRPGKNGAWEKPRLAGTTRVLVLRLLKDVFVHRATHEILLSVHHAPGTLVHPLQLLFSFPIANDSILFWVSQF